MRSCSKHTGTARKFVGFEDRHSRWLTQALACPTIEGGESAKCGRYPYMVSLRDREDNHKCGGVLIHSHWVFTAAHCLGSASLGEAPIIVIGACQIDDKRNEANDNGVVEIYPTPDKVVIHPDWNGNVKDGNDVALLRLASESQHTPVALPPSGFQPLPGQKLVVIGWGLLETGCAPTDLQQSVDIDLLKNVFCSTKEAWGPIIKDSMACGFFPSQDICKGDSGGPLLVGHAPDGNINDGNPGFDILFGTASFGSGECGNKDRPSVYTRVVSFVDWIKGMIGGTGPDVLPSSPPAPQPSISPSPQSFVASSPQPSVVPSPEPSVSPPPQPSASSSPQPLVSPSSRPPRAPSNQPASAPRPASPATSALTPLPGCKPLDKTVIDNECVVPPPAEDMPQCTAALDPSKCQEQRHAVDSNETNCNALEALVDGKDCCLFTVFPSGWTLLHLAVRNAKGSVVESLINSGLDVEATTVDGSRPLHIAAKSGNRATIIVLARAGADVESMDVLGWTPMHVAIEFQQVDAIKALVESDADVEAPSADGGLQDGYRPLHRAAYWGDISSISTLVQVCADVEGLDANGRTPLYVASRRGHLDAVETLLTAGANSDATDTAGKTPLYTAVSMGHANVVHALLNVGADVDVPNADGMTPLHVAANMGNAKIAEALLKANADIDAQDTQGRTPLHLAAKAGHLGMVQILMKAGVYINARDETGLTALHVAARRGDVDVVQALMNADADCRAKDDMGNTPRNRICESSSCVDGIQAQLKDLLC